MTIVLNFPNPEPGDRIGKLSRFLAVRRRPSGHTLGSPRHSPEVGHPVPDLPRTKRGRRRLTADDGCATRYDANPIHGNIRSSSNCRGPVT